MAIRLALYSENDLEGKPALFVMFSSLPEIENPTGLGAQRRTFHFTRDLIEALRPAGIDALTPAGPGYLSDLAKSLEQGKGNMFEISNEQAWNIGMLPQRDGFQWVQVTISKTATGDGSPRYSVTYQVDDRTVGTGFEDTFDKLETLVRQLVALDWAAIGRQLERQDGSSTVLHLPDETVRYIFDGEL